MDQNELLKIIERAAEEKSTELDLHGEDITTLPAEIGKLTDLTKLYLPFNQLTSIPSELGNLTNLTVLYVHANQLTSIPAELGNLKNLEMLNLYDNKTLTYPPPEVVKQGTKAILTYLQEKLAQDENKFEKEDVRKRNSRRSPTKQTDKRQAKKDERTDGQDVSGDEGGGDNSRKVLKDNLIAFLVSEKKFPRESLNQSIYAEAPYIDLAVTYPDTDNILAIFSFIKTEIDSISFRKPSEILAKVHKVGFVGEYNPFVYTV